MSADAYQSEQSPTADVSMVRVTVVAGNIEALVGMCHAYGRQYVANLNRQLENPNLATLEAEALATKAVAFTKAFADLLDALTVMAEAGAGLEAAGDMAPYTVLFTKSERKFLVDIIKASRLNYEAPEAQKFSREDIDLVKTMVTDTLAKLEAGVEVSLAELEAEKKQGVPKPAPATPVAAQDVPPGFFAQNKIGKA